MSDDLIKRSDAIKAVRSTVAQYVPFLNGINMTLPLECETALRSVPSANRPQGEWIDEGRNLWGCSNCGMGIYSESERDRNEFHKWCSRCGARMKGTDDE